jgi:hypothetical protein
VAHLSGLLSLQARSRRNALRASRLLRERRLAVQEAAQAAPTGQELPELASSRTSARAGR